MIDISDLATKAQQTNLAMEKRLRAIANDPSASPRERAGDLAQHRRNYEATLCSLKRQAANDAGNARGARGKASEG